MAAGSALAMMPAALSADLASPSPSITFAGFQLDLGGERLLKDGRALSLRRKPYLILSYLARNPRRLVTREELMGAVWGHRAMSDSLVRTHVRDLRRVLGTELVETVAGRGYRFHVDVNHVDDRLPTQQRLVGRDAELGAMRRELERVTERGPRCVFVTGDVGVGKTTLVERFANEAAVRTAAYVGRGACIEPYGNSHPYLPILGALGDLCRGPKGYRVIDVLTCYAPGWLVQIPGLAQGERRSQLQHVAATSTHANMLNELGGALDALSCDAPVVLVLEDLHWADIATVELLAFLCQRGRPLHCLILGTLRASEIARAHPLWRALSEWIAHGRGVRLDIDGFAAAALDDYLIDRFPGHSFGGDLTTWLLEATGGNPLLVEAVVNELQQRGLIRQQDGGWTLATTVEGIDVNEFENVLRLVDAQVDRLRDFERRILEIGSAEARTFDTSVIARAMHADLEDVDLACKALTQRRLLIDIDAAEGADGPIQHRFRFRQSLTFAALLRRGPCSAPRASQREIVERPINVS
jgi:DNA-binding winged helix-turn-helix (wHTH) protein